MVAGKALICGYSRILLGVIFLEGFVSRGDDNYLFLLVVNKVPFNIMNASSWGEASSQSTAQYVSVERRMCFTMTNWEEFEI